MAAVLNLVAWLLLWGGDAPEPAHTGCIFSPPFQWALLRKWKSEWEVVFIWVQCELEAL